MEIQNENSISKNSLNSQYSNNENSIQKYINNKNLLNSKNENGWTPIYHSIISNNLILLKQLLELGANVNIPNNMNETPLYQSIEMENYEAMIILLKYNCDCNISKNNGNSPLHIACKKGKINFISALLKNGANPNLINKLFNQTPFHIVIIQKLGKNIISLFKEYNGDLYNIKDKYDKSPFDYCKENGEEYEKMVLSIFNNNNINNKINNNNNNKINSNKNDKNNKFDFINSEYDNSDNLINNNIENNDFNKEETPKRNISTMKFPENISSSELIGKSNFDSSKSKSLIIKNEKSRNDSSSNNKEKIKSIITETIKKINIDSNDTSNFNFSTPKNLINNNNKNNISNIQEPNLFNLDNQISSFLSEKNNNHNKENSTSEMNPLDLINQVITTTNNSNIFSELQLNTLQDRLNTDEVKKNCNSGNKINDYIQTIGTNDMEYSKSKSYIISDLHKENFNSNSIQTKNEIDLSNISIINSRKSNNENNENIENKNPNLIQIEENSDEHSISPFNNKLISMYSNNNSNSRNNYLNSTASNCESNINNTGNNINKEIKILNLNPNYSNLYNSNSTSSREIQRNVNLINNNNKSKISNNNNKFNNKKNINLNNTHNNPTSIIPINIINGNNTFYSFNTPLFNIHRKKSSLLTEYSNKNNNNQNNNFNDEEDSITEYPTNNQISKLRNWLISCNLVSYLNLLINNNIYQIDKLINGIKNEDLNINYKDVEQIGIRKPGHIFRFLLKLNIDSGKIDDKIINYLSSVCTSNNNIELSNNDIKCCCFRINEKNSVTNYSDIFSYLKSKKLSYLKENFIHNGFEYVDYIIIQFFSKYTFDDESLIEYLHIYNEEDRKKVLRTFLREKKKICNDLNIPFEDKININLNIESDDSENCGICSIF